MVVGPERVEDRDVPACVVCVGARLVEGGGMAICGGMVVTGGAVVVEAEGMVPA